MSDPVLTGVEILDRTANDPRAGTLLLQARKALEEVEGQRSALARLIVAFLQSRGGSIVVDGKLFNFANPDDGIEVDSESLPGRVRVTLKSASGISRRIP